jgi:alginate O-acetyltransferase complex protein AlgI
MRPRICALFGIAFFVYFSLEMDGGWLGATCVLLFFWECSFRFLYHPGKRWYLAGVAFSLAILIGFKYWNFLTDSSWALFTSSPNPWHWSDAFLPLGVSFFTFEFIHYAVDRYRGKTEAGTFAEYLAFIFFFPTMVAGPIKRFQDFLPCLRAPSQDWVLDWNRGITRILSGLVKKFVFADLLASLSDHLNTHDIAVAERWVLPIWLVAFGWKIYFDFSAYSDIAIGSGRLFGIRIPENFDWPYTRTNIAEFWKHWHISLYRWLVDYVFIPMGGSRGSLWSVCRNIMLVMLVSGIWHGAGMHFVVWGAWHGFLLVVHRLWSIPNRLRSQLSHSYWYKPASWLLTYVAVNLGWAFFAMDMKTCQYFFERLVFG